MDRLSGNAEFAGLMRNPFYAAMPEAARAAVEARGRLRRFAAGQMVFAKGDESDGAYALLSGELEYSTVSPSGKQSVLNMLPPGKWLGDLSTLDGSGRTLDCRALKDSVLMHLTPGDFDTLLESVPAFSRMLLLIQSDRIRQLLVWIETLTKLNAEGRLAERLLLFAEAVGGPVENGVTLDVRLTQEHVAELIGTTRQRVNQIINRWQDDGLIRQDGKAIVLCDVDALRAYVDLA